VLLSKEGDRSLSQSLIKLELVVDAVI